MEVKYIILKKNITYNDLRRYESLLPDYRREKIARYRFDADKLRSLIAGLLIRQATGGGELVFGEHEKPYLADGSLYFSVSHSGDVVAIATDDSELGVDVEAIPKPDRLSIADRFFHPCEREYVHGSADEARAFCRVWTRKEAYLKCTGEGISSDLTSFDVLSEPLSSRIVTRDLDGYCLSVCSTHLISEEDIYFSKLELNQIV